MRTLVSVATTAVVSMVLFPAFAIGLALATTSLSLPGWLAGLSIPLALAAGYYAARFSALPDLWVGEDGIRVRRGTGERFIPFGEIVGAEAEGEKVAIHLSSGRCERFTTRTAQGGDGGDPQQAREVALAVRGAMAMSPRASQHAAVLVAKHFLLGRPEMRRVAGFGIGALAFVPTFSVLTSLLALLVVAPGLLPAWALWAGAIPAAWLGRWCARRFALPELRVGTDGVAIQRRGRDEYVPYEELEAVEAKAETVLIRRVDGTTDSLSTRTAQGGDKGDPDQVLEVVAAIQAAMEARGLSRSAGARALVERQGRTIDAWRAALVGLVERGSDYRQSSLTSEDLVRVLEDPSAPPEQRIGAALGLRGLAGPEGEGTLSKIRIAAAATANPRVRIALSKAADDELDEAAVEEACEEDAAARSETGAPGAPAV